MKIHQNWLVWPILLLKKKGPHFTTYFSKGNFRRKNKGPLLDTRHFDQMDLFFYETDLDDIYGGG